MERIYCLLHSSKISKCYLERGQSFLKACLECTYYQDKENKRRWLLEIKQCRENEAEEDRKNKEALQNDIVRFISGPLPEPKESNTKLPKEVPRTNLKSRRIRFDTDYWKRNRFQAKLCLLENRIGRKSIQSMSIEEILKQPEMKGFRSSRIRTLKAWRQEIHKNIYVGRPKKIKSNLIKKIR